VLKILAGSLAAPEVVLQERNFDLLIVKAQLYMISFPFKHLYELLLRDNTQIYLTPRQTLYF
jgi:hypothetical protein